MPFGDIPVVIGKVVEARFCEGTPGALSPRSKATIRLKARPLTVLCPRATTRARGSPGGAPTAPSCG